MFNGFKEKFFSKEKYGEIAKKEIQKNYKETLEGMNILLVFAEFDFSKAFA